MDPKSAEKTLSFNRFEMPLNDFAAKNEAQDTNFGTLLDSKMDPKSTESELTFPFFQETPQLPT